MLKPDLIEFKDGELAPADGFNYNFEQTNKYVLGTSDELKALVNSAIANLNLQLTQAVFTGKIEMFAGKADNIPTGWLLCDGRELDREEYSKLYEAIGVKYGAGNGVTTFNLPNYIGRFLEGATEAGIVKEAGLPAHTHSLTLPRVWGNGRNADYGSAWGGDDINRGNSTATISVTNSTDSIFGKSDTVQPPAVTILYIIKT